MTQQVSESLSARVALVLSLSPELGAVEYGGAWTSWGSLAKAGEAIESLLHPISANGPVGWVARNRPASVAVFASLVVNGRPIAPLRPNQSLAGFHEEIRGQRLVAVIADESDWAIEGVRDAARGAGSMGISISAGPNFAVSLVCGLEEPGPGPHRTEAPGMVVERMSSGTTGAAKRIRVDAQVLLPALRSAEEASSRKGAAARLAVKSSPGIILSPFTHSGGIFALLFALYQARPIVLFEKFTVDAWVDALQRHRPKSASLVPAMIRMVLASDIPDDALSCLSAVRCGTAPLEPEVQLAFEQRFHIPVLIDFGATEFIGGVAGWSIADHKSFSAAKRGSVGRPRPDVQLRAIQPETLAVLGAGEIGLLEIKSPRFGEDWVRTTDLASLDEDGFLYIHGRADDAINRGGFKILPDEVAAVLRRFPGVDDVAIVGFPDDRLGQVPVAVVETARKLDALALDAFARKHLASYQVPVEFRFIDALPRTTTLKVNRPALKALLGLADAKVPT